MNIKRKYLAFTLISMTMAYLLYVVYHNFIYDPLATAFLSHKTDLRRPLQVPVWLTVMQIHVIFACIVMLAGVINLLRKTWVKYQTFHKINGYIYIVAVVMVVLTSGYMAPYSTGGKVNSIAFNLVNIIWPGMTIAALVQIKRKQIQKHRKWMIRSYAFCFLNLFIHMITFLFHHGLGMDYSTSYTFGVYGSILIILVSAELVVRFIDLRPSDWLIQKQL